MHRRKFSIAGSKSGAPFARTTAWWRGGLLLRRDRRDLSNEPSIPDKVYIVLNEPNLIIGAEFSEHYAEADSNVLAQAVQDYLIDSSPPASKLRLKLNGTTEFEAWNLMEDKKPGHIIVDVGNVRNNLDMACRLVRHQHGQGGTYAMYLDPKQSSYFEKHHGWQHAIKELGANHEAVNGATVLLRGRLRTRVSRPFW